MKVTQATADATFNAWWRVCDYRQGAIAQALANTKQQIGPPMPDGYMPPPWRHGGAPQSLEQVARGNPDLEFLLWDPSKPQSVPAEKQVQMVSRIIYQEFREENCGANQKGDTPIFDAFNDLFKRATSGGNRERVFGNENRSARKTAMFPKGYVVMSVDAYKTVSSTNTTYAACRFTEMRLTYKWGPYCPTIHVIAHYEGRGPVGQPHKESKDFWAERHTIDKDYLPSE